jgi:carbohydrate-selective porin OprB
MNNRIVVAALTAAALAVPTVAVAQPGKGHEKQTTKAHGKAKTPKKVTFVFKGKFTAPGTVEVTSGNSHVRKGGYVGQLVTFDLATAKVVAADTNADLKVDVTDVKDGDVVLVQARVAKRTKFEEGAEAIAARKLVDKTNPPVDDSTDAPAS